GSAALSGERPADAGVLPAFVAGGVELVDAAVAVAGDERMAVRQTDRAIGIVDGLLPIHFAGKIDLLHLTDAAEGDKIAAVAQPFDAAPGEAAAELDLGNERSFVVDLGDFAAGVNPEVMPVGELTSVVGVP